MDYYSEHREKILAYQKEYNSVHKEKIREYQREYFQRRKTAERKNLGGLVKEVKEIIFYFD